MTDQEIDIILDAIAQGKSLRGVCSEMKLHACTFIGRVNNDEELAKRYTRAIELRADVHFHDMEDLVETCDDPQMLRAKIDAKKWILGKMRPVKYGDKQQIEHTGEVVTKVVRAFGG